MLLLDPTEEKYPENDGQVKLFYVAATRALHELAVLYTGELTGILAKEAPKGRHNQEFAMETLTKAKEYEKVSLTQKECVRRTARSAFRRWTSGTVMDRNGL